MPKPTTLILILLCVSTGPTIFRLGSGAGCPSFCVVLIHGPTLANVTTSKSTSMDKMIGNDRLAMALQTKTVREPELTHFFDNNIPILRAEYGRRLPAKVREGPRVCTVVDEVVHVPHQE